MNPFYTGPPVLIITYVLKYRVGIAVLHHLKTL